MLDAAHVHDDAADIAEELKTRPDRVHRKDLCGAGAIKLQDVVTLIAFDQVIAVARIPDERVGAVAAKQKIGPPVAIEPVVAQVPAAGS